MCKCVVYVCCIIISIFPIKIKLCMCKCVVHVCSTIISIIIGIIRNS
jgi:hypothetical protein